MKVELQARIKTSAQKRKNWAPQFAVPVPEYEPEPWRAWIEPQDYSFVRWLDEPDEEHQLAIISLEWTDEMETLLKAYPNICYDNDPNVCLLADEDGGNIDLEIFWAVTYRGGLMEGKRGQNESP